jgi:hypothetical protein
MALGQLLESLLELIGIKLGSDIDSAYAGVRTDGQAGRDADRGAADAPGDAGARPPPAAPDRSLE